jgi:hypothetical protein
MAWARKLKLPSTAWISQLFGNIHAIERREPYPWRLSPGPGCRGMRVAWFRGKLLGRFLVVFLPVFLAMLAAIAWGMFKAMEIPRVQVVYYTGFLLSLTLCFLSIGMLISTLARSCDVATGTAYIIWLVLLLFMDLMLLGLRIRQGMPSEDIIAVALLNPLQVFRTVPCCCRSCARNRQGCEKATATKRKIRRRQSRWLPVLLQQAGSQGGSCSPSPGTA